MKREAKEKEKVNTKRTQFNFLGQGKKSSSKFSGLVFKYQNKMADH
jgi:hypothetical protein